MYQAFKEFLEQELSQNFDLHPRPIPNGLAEKVSERGKNPATIQSWCYQCSELRKIRYTYIDAGKSAQIFNSVIYPNHHYDLPLLGVDFLTFGEKKNLVVLDFQPLFQDEAYLRKYIDPITEIRDKYSDLAQNLGMKFYDANRFFSKNLLFAKTDPDSIHNRLFPAYQEYLHLYWQMVKEAQPLSDASAVAKVIEAQKEYDRYSAERDPAHGLFSSYFGNEWANRFLHEFLFEDALSLAVV
jgi:15,16-dihydrobiliverdin:ferredoxin oxidoreductase